jgi:hypothetical protein
LLLKDFAREHFTATKLHQYAFGTTQLLFPTGTPAGSVDAFKHCISELSRLKASQEQCLERKKLMK